MMIVPSVDAVFMLIPPAVALGQISATFGALLIAAGKAALSPSAIAGVAMDTIINTPIKAAEEKQLWELRKTIDVLHNNISAFCNSSVTNASLEQMETWEGVPIGSFMIPDLDTIDNDHSYSTKFESWPKVLMPPVLSDKSNSKMMHLDGENKTHNISKRAPAEQLLTQQEFRARQDSTSDLWDNMTFTRPEIWPETEFTYLPDQAIIRLKQTLSEVVFSYDNREYQMRPFFTLEEKAIKEAKRLLSFYDSKFRYTYVGRMPARRCLLACSALGMSVTPASVYIKNLLGPDELFWVEPEYSRQDMRERCPPMDHRTGSVVERLDLIYAVNSSDPLYNCLTSVTTSLSRDNFKPNCVFEGNTLTNVFLSKTGIKSLDECMLLCLTRTDCVYFTYARGKKSHIPNECNLSSHNDMKSIQDTDDRTTSSFSMMCAICKNGGWPHLRIGKDNLLPLRGECQGKAQIYQPANCVCLKTGEDQEAIISRGVVQNLYAELGTNALETKNDRQMKGTDQLITGRRRPRRSIASRVSTWGRSVGQAIRLSQVSSYINRVIGSGVPYQALVPYRGVPVRTPFLTRANFKNAITQTGKGLKKGLYWARDTATTWGPLIGLGLSGYLVYHLAKGDQEVTLKLDLSNLPPQFRNDELFNEDWNLKDDFNFMQGPLSPEVSSSMLTLPKEKSLRWVEEEAPTNAILDYATARTALQDLYQLAEMVRQGAKLFNFLRLGGTIGKQGQAIPPSENVFAQINGTQIEQTIIQPTNQTSELQYYSAIIVPLTGSELRSELFFSGAVDSKGALLDSTNPDRQCVMSVIQNKQLERCFAPQPNIQPVTIMSISPTHHMIRLIAQNPWKVILNCPTSNVFEKKVFRPISVLVLHKQCVLTYFNGRPLWEDEVSAQEWSKLPVNALLKVIYKADITQKVDVNWLLTVLCLLGWLVTTLVGIGIFLLLRFGRQCRVTIWPKQRSDVPDASQAGVSDMVLLKKSESSYSLPSTKSCFKQVEGPHEMVTFKGFPKPSCPNVEPDPASEALLSEEGMESKPATLPRAMDIIACGSAPTEKTDSAQQTDKPVVPSRPRSVLVHRSDSMKEARFPTAFRAIPRVNISAQSQGSLEPEPSSND